MRGFGTSDTCEVNVNCPEGEEWQYQKNGVVRIIVKSGFSSFWCSGSIVNNARNDCTPFLLTADHCGPHASEENYDQWVFYFRYEGDDCDDPESDSTFKSYTIVGAKKLAGNGGAAGKASDFKLLKLNENIPVTYNPFYNGWSIANEPSPSGTSIHHPDGDIKKISTYTDTLKSSNWGGQFPIPTGGLFGRKPKQTGGALLKADHREAPPVRQQWKDNRTAHRRRSKL